MLAREFFAVAAVAMLMVGCAATEECASADAGPSDAGPDRCDDENVERAAGEAFEPAHIIDHVEDMLP